MPVALVVLAGVVATARYLHDGAEPDASVGSDPAVAASAPIEVAFTNLVRVDGRLQVADEPAAFTGTTVEHYPDGSVRSRTAVIDGLLEGLSEGWYPNGQLQISERFVAGLSHGVRTKWYASGAVLSEAHFANGQLHGRFRRWHENGVLAEEIEFREGEPDGVSRAWYPSGHLKARVVMRFGQPIEQRFWSEGEVPARGVTGFPGDTGHPVSGD